MAAVDEFRDITVKVLVVGEAGAGKTCLIKRSVTGLFLSNYKATVGVDFALKKVQWDPNLQVKMQLWDIAGQEQFASLTRVYYRDAVGAFIVFDVTSRNSYAATLVWKKDIDEKVTVGPDKKPIPCILLVNKYDLPKETHVVAEPDLNKFVEDNNFCGWFFTSAKDNLGIEDAIRGLTGKILEIQPPEVLADPEPENPGTVVLEAADPEDDTVPAKKSSGCDC
ncbi:Rab GTPase [Pelomyxa schiedti]|nr:Rab GTPase [Pelomyxa schiedti]